MCFDKKRNANNISVFFFFKNNIFLLGSPAHIEKYLTTASSLEMVGKKWSWLALSKARKIATVFYSVSHKIYFSVYLTGEPGQAQLPELRGLHHPLHGALPNRVEQVSFF